MESISELMLAAQAKIGEGEADKSIPAAIVKLVNDIFLFFYSICRGFKKQYADTKLLALEKAQWMKAFMDEKILTREQVEHGIKRTRRESPINTPTIGQFLDWCAPSLESQGVPTVEKAFDEACKNANPCNEKVWSHKLVKHASKLTGSYFLSTNARSVSLPVFQRNYEIAIREWRAGKEIEEISVPLAITKAPDSARSDVIRKKAIADCMAMLKGISTELSPKNVENFSEEAVKSCDGEEILPF